MTEILSIGAWRNNGEMIADVAMLGYLDDQVLDVTFGEGKFWTSWRPQMLTASDLHKDVFVAASVAGIELYEAYQWDYRAIPCETGEYEVVVFDPPYKLNGTPALGEQDARYGTEQRTTRDEVMTDIRLGALECYRVCANHLLVKVMDQVEGGRKRWQTDMVTRAIEDAGGRKIDRFDIALAGRPQPADQKCKGCRGTGTDPDWRTGDSEMTKAHAECLGSGRVDRTQRTSRSKHSTLLVFEKGRAPMR